MTSHQPNPLRSGVRIDVPSAGVRGTLGLLIRAADGRIAALTASTVVPPGEAATGPVGDQLLATLGASRLMATLDPEQAADAAGMIVRLDVPETAAVSAWISGVDQAGEPATPIEAAGQPLVLSRGALRIQVGRLVAVGGGAAIRWPDGARRIVSNLAELSLGEHASLLEAGDAGGLVMTDDSRPFGLVVGEVDGTLLVAPLARELKVAGLRPLDAWSALEHNARARDRAAALVTPRFRSAVWQDEGPSSQKLRQQLDPARMVAMVEEDA